MLDIDIQTLSESDGGRRRVRRNTWFGITRRAPGSRREGKRESTIDRCAALAKRASPLEHRARRRQAQTPGLPSPHRQICDTLVLVAQNVRLSVGVPCLEYSSERTISREALVEAVAEHHGPSPSACATGCWPETLARARGLAASATHALRGQGSRHPKQRLASRGVDGVTS